MRVLCLLVGLMFASAGFTQGLKSQLQPGGIYRGKVSPGSRVTYQDKQVRVGSEGHFILGFGRDAPLEQFYKVVSGDGRETRVELVLIPRKYEVSRLTGIAKKYVSPKPEMLKRIQSESARIKEARKVDSLRQDFLNGFLWPVKGRVSGVYGSQRIYNGKPGRPHYGLDVAVPTGTPVQAPASGKVRLAETDLYYSGGTIIIDHGHGLTSSFLHLSKVSVEAGQNIERGDIIGAVGATGRVTGAHLDWRYNWFDQRLDPALLTVK